MLAFDACDLTLHLLDLRDIEKSRDDAADTRDHEVHENLHDVNGKPFHNGFHPRMLPVPLMLRQRWDIISIPIRSDLSAISDGC